MATKKAAKKRPAVGKPKRLRIEYVDPATLKEDGKKNARLHDERNADALRESIKAHGATTAIGVQRSRRRIVFGNLRFRIYRELGFRRVPIVFLDLTDRQARALAIRDNRVAELGEWSAEALAESLEFAGVDLDAAGDAEPFGFTDADLDELIRQATPDDDDQDEGGGPESRGATPTKFKVLVECADESEQAKLVAELERRRFKCSRMNS